MIIKRLDGSEIDTDKLADLEALLLEKSEEFRMLCEKTNTSFLLITTQKSKKSSDIFFNYPITKIQEESFSKMVHTIHLYLLQRTNNHLGVYPTEFLDVEAFNNYLNNLKNNSDNEN